LYTELTFVADFIRAYPSWDRSERSVHAMNLCFQVYQNAANAPLRSLVIGRITRPVPPVGGPPIIGIGDVERLNFGTSSERAGGSVLWSRYWSIPLNDSWLLGGVHAALPFYLASPRTASNLNDPTHGMTVTARELIGLKTFGYQMNPNTRLGEVFECADPHRAATATLQQYQRAVEESQRSSSIAAML
jgi:hypothetical protein